MRKIKNQVIILIWTVIIMVSFFTFEVSALDISVVIDGKKVEFSQTSGLPFIDQANRTQVPFRQTMEQFGCTVSWDSVNKVAIAEKNGITVKVPIGVSYVIKNGQQIKNDTAAIIKDSHTYLPIRAVLEAFGADVKWDNVNKIVTVTKKNAPIDYVDTIKESITVGQTFELPNYINAVATDETIISAPVLLWKYREGLYTFRFDEVEMLDPGMGINETNGHYTLKTNEAGDYIFVAIIEGYDKFVSCIVTVKPSFETEEVPELSGVSDLLEYLNDNYSTLDTPAGEWNFTFNINENDTDVFGYDYEILVDWTGVEPYDVQHSLSLSDEAKESTKRLLTQFQKEVANAAFHALPGKKVQGGFYSGFYKYPYLKVGYETIQFLSWSNYKESFDYDHSNISEFHWESTSDDYKFVVE